MTRRTLLLTASCLAPFCLTAAARAEARFDFDKTPGRLPKTVVPSAYRIDLVPDLKKLTLGGHETIAVTFRQAQNDVVMEDVGLTITHATLEDGTAATATADAANQEVTLHFPHEVAAGAHTLTIDYTGTIPNTPAGLYYNDYSTASGPAKRMLVTQFENIDARRMFPGWDEPVFKASFRLSAVLPTDYVAISNMPVVSTTPAGGARHRRRHQACRLGAARRIRPGAIFARRRT
jgi:aminopeptidase N